MLVLYLLVLQYQRIKRDSFFFFFFLKDRPPPETPPLPPPAPLPIRRAWGPIPPPPPRGTPPPETPISPPAPRSPSVTPPVRPAALVAAASAAFASLRSGRPLWR